MSWATSFDRDPHRSSFPQRQSSLHQIRNIVLFNEFCNGKMVGRGAGRSIRGEAVQRSGGSQDVRCAVFRCQGEDGTAIGWQLF